MSLLVALYRIVCKLIHTQIKLGKPASCVMARDGGDDWVEDSFYKGRKIE